jgi:tRNA A37 threonylcarbamoyladenosine synthetase subunit TsaC/SUA5/YrdC
MVSRGLGSEPVTAVKVSTRDGRWELMSSREAAERVIDVIDGGGLALVPFDVAYAFITGSISPLQRIYQLKLRPPKKACPVLVSWEQFVDIADSNGRDVERLKRVVDAGLPVGVLTTPDWESDAARSIPQDCVHLLVSQGKLALFMNMGGMSEDLLEIANQRGVRLFGSSANISGMGNSFSLDDVPDEIVEAMDIVCEIGPCKYKNPDRLPTSIVDLETGTLTRSGILHDEIGRLLGE